MTSVPLSASAATVRPWWQRRPRLSTESLILLASGFFALACNGPFWHGAVATRPNDPAFTLVLLVLLVAVHALLLGLLLWGPLTRPLLSVLLLTTAGATYYMGRYGVYLDTDMLRNVLATDRKESSELITPTLLLALLGYAAVPIALLWRLRLRRVGFWRALWRRLLFLAALVLVIALTALAAGQGVASLLRNHREIRYLATPANYLVALAQAARSRPAADGPKQPIGIDAHVDARPPGSRPRLLVIVLGETARAQNWGLNGYRRQTTPELAALPAVINFPDMHACGTSTEVSVPCMFSP